MSLRAKERPVVPAAPPKDELLEIRVRGANRLEALWLVHPVGANPRRVIVQVSKKMAAQIMARATFGSVIDMIEEDTYPAARAAG